VGGERTKNMTPLFKNYAGEIGDLEDIKNYNEFVSASAFFNTTDSQYQDWCGNWRDIGDINPIVTYPDPEIIDGEVLDDDCESFWLNE
jgi:hypothetical protein